MTFITKSTKVNAIVACSMIGVLLLTLVMMSTLISVSYKTKVIISFTYAASVLVITLLWQGILKLKVFTDYKWQNKLLCAEGVISIVMSALLLICGVLFGALQVSAVINHQSIIGSDIRIFIAVFMGIMAIWKLVLFIVDAKHKHPTCWYDLVIVLAWFGLATVFVLSMIINSLEVLAWISISLSWLLTLLYLAYLLHSYVICVPTYLETPKAVEMYEKEQEDIKMEEEMIRAKALRKATSTRDMGKSSINEKLKKLRELKDAGLISAKNYEDKKADILNEL